ncbi:MAG: glutaminyl-peptide cyclotransferase [Bacteroidota bacterium]
MIHISYFFVIIGILLLSCSDGKKEANSRSISPRVKKNTKIESPAQNENFIRGTAIPVSFSSSTANIDSVQIITDNSKSSYASSAFEFSFKDRKVGTRSMRAKVFCGGESETHYRKVIVLPESPPEEMTYKIVNTYPHDPEDYTQGLLIKDGYLFESSGQRGRSTLKKKEITTGKTIKVANLDADLFGEGLAVFDDEFYQLTWTSGKGFVYNENLEQIRTFSYEVQGWGLTTLGNQFVFTDETEKLYFMEPQSFIKQSELEVYDNDGKVDSINELEVIEGKIFANVYREDFVVVISPETGEVLQRIDFSGLLTEQESNNVDVLNGIAVDPETGKIYVTGKYWPKLFEVTIESKNI